MNDTNSNFEIHEKIKDICFGARKSWFSLANLSTDKKNELLLAVAEQLELDKEIILSANKIDLENAQANSLSKAMIDRLTLNEERLKTIQESVKQIATLPDPVGVTLDKTTRPNGLEISRITVPIGVIALIFESRPNVTVEAAALAIKSGNAIILKGGKEAFHSNSAFAYSIGEALTKKKINKDIVNLIPFKEREATAALLKEKEHVDLVIPRGGEGLINYVTENSLIPVIKHYKGLCHTYIDRTADVEQAISIAVNAKAQRPGVCNAMETLLVDEAIAPSIMTVLAEKMKQAGVKLKGCEKTRLFIKDIEEATEEDWATEYLEKILSIKVVSDIDEAIEHIENYGSRHSEAIITKDQKKAAHFVQNIDASAVFINSSTRFNDGFEFGLGAEMGISTDKLHCRGPMGLREMTTYKYVVLGNGQVK